MELYVEFIYRLNTGGEIFIMAEGTVGRNDDEQWEIADDLSIQITVNFYKANWMQIQAEEKMIEQAAMQRLISEAIDAYENKGHDD